MELFLIALLFVLEQDCIYPGAGEDPVDEFKSIILYHRNDPKWDETVKVG